MMGDHKLSIIIPIYNCEKYIGECLDSLIDQDIPIDQYEIICVNDGSKDNSQKIIDDYSKCYSFIRSIKKENGGVSSARNTGIKHADGEYLIFVDSDDYMCANVLGTTLKVAELQKAEIVMWGFRSVQYGYNKQVVEEKIQFDDFKIQPQKSSNSLWRLMIKKNLITDNHLQFDERMHYGEDSMMSFFVHIFALGKKGLQTHSRFYNYRILDSSLSRKIDTRSEEWAKSRVENFLFRIQDCKKLLCHKLNLEQKREIERKIHQYTSTIIVNLIRCERYYAEKIFNLLKEQGLYPYSIIYAVTEYDAQNNALTYKKRKDYFRLLIFHHIMSIKYNIGIIALDIESIYNIIWKIKKGKE